MAALVNSWEGAGLLIGEIEADGAVESFSRGADRTAAEEYEEYEVLVGVAASQRCQCRSAASRVPPSPGPEKASWILTSHGNHARRGG
jgi:hypothetical protein